MIGVIGVAFYIVSLIVQDTITLSQAEVIGYSMAIVITGLVIATLLLITYNEEEKKQLVLQHEIDNQKIKDFEAELNRLRNIK